MSFDVKLDPTTQALLASIRAASEADIAKAKENSSGVIAKVTETASSALKDATEASKAAAAKAAEEQAKASAEATATTQAATVEAAKDVQTASSTAQNAIVTANTEGKKDVQKANEESNKIIKSITGDVKALEQNPDLLTKAEKTKEEQNTSTRLKIYAILAVIGLLSIATGVGLALVLGQIAALATLHALVPIAAGALAGTSLFAICSTIAWKCLNPTNGE